MEVPSWSIGIEESNTELVWTTLSARPLWPVVLCSVLEAPRPDTHMLLCSDSSHGQESLGHWSELGEHPGAPIGVVRHTGVFHAYFLVLADRAAWTLAHLALLDKCPKQD